MYQLWSHANCPNEGRIDDLVYEDVHKEVIEYMFNFYKNKYPEVGYSTRFEEVKLSF
tara:strand:- start:27 stop:197 length:171 start_codon:yes stop_codon:yes gene_type:complete